MPPVQLPQIVEHYEGAAADTRVMKPIALQNGLATSY